MIDDDTYEPILCPFCGDRYECPHVLLCLDLTSMCAEAGALANSFNSKIKRSSYDFVTVENGDEFDYFEKIIQHIADQTIQYTTEGGPGKSLAYKNYYSLDENKIGLAEGIFKLVSSYLPYKLSEIEITEKLLTAYEECHKQINNWIRKTNFNIITSIPQNGVVSRSRYRRALHKFLSEYLLFSNYFPVGKWQIKINLPARSNTTQEISESTNESMIQNINKAGLETFIADFSMDILASPFSGKLPFSIGSISERLLIINSNLNLDNDDIEFEFDTYQESKPISKEWPPGSDIALCDQIYHDEITTLKILSKLKTNGFYEKFSY